MSTDREIEIMGRFLARAGVDPQPLTWEQRRAAREYGRQWDADVRAMREAGR